MKKMKLLGDLVWGIPLAILCTTLCLTFLGVCVGLPLWLLYKLFFVVLP